MPRSHHVKVDARPNYLQSSFKLVSTRFKEILPFVYVGETTLRILNERIFKRN